MTIAGQTKQTKHEKKIRKLGVQRIYEVYGFCGDRRINALLNTLLFSISLFSIGQFFRTRYIIQAWTISSLSVTMIPLHPKEKKVARKQQKPRAAIIAEAVAL